MSTEDGVLLDASGNVIGACSSVPVLTLLGEAQDALRAERAQTQELANLWQDLCDKKILLHRPEAMKSVLRIGALLGVTMVVNKR